MTTNVKVFKSTDAGAPAMSGTAGALIGVLDAALVNGYGGGTVASITRSGSTATANLTAHGFATGDCVLHAGANQSEYNGEFYITVVDANSYTFEVAGAPATPATGTITTKKAPAGWSKAFSGTNLAAYRQGGGSLLYYRVDDTPAQYPRLVGYETMSDVNTGTGPFPTAAQFSGGLYAAKSTAANATARTWVVIATDRLFYLMIDADGGATANQLYWFGDIKSYKAGDAYGTIIIGNNSGAVGNNYSGYVTADPNAVATGHYMARSYTQLGASLTVGKHTDAAKTRSANHIGNNGLIYPNPVDGGLYMAPVWIHEPGYLVRGEMPGLWAPCHQRPLNHMDTLSGAGALAGKTFLYFNINSASQAASALIETSNTWSI